MSKKFKKANSIIQRIGLSIRKLNLKKKEIRSKKQICLLEILDPQTLRIRAPAI